MSAGIDLAAAFNNTFGMTQEAAPAKETLPIALLVPFSDHPYRVTDLDELTQSIAENGVMVPVTVRPAGSGAYEIISGHRRVEAARNAGLDSVPVIIKKLSDDDAVIEMVDSNISRTDILPSERVKAYKMRMEAANRRGEKKQAIEDISKSSGDSRAQIYRILQLDNLIDGYMDKVDNGEVSFESGVIISSMPEERQEEALAFEAGRGKPLTKDEFAKIKAGPSDTDIGTLLAKKTAGRPKTVYVRIRLDDVSRYFPNNEGLGESDYKDKVQRMILKTLHDAYGDNKDGDNGGWS